MADTVYGLDLACGPADDGAFDLDVHAPPVEGLAALAQALAHRLVTPRGSLLDDPTYGEDARAWVNDDLDDSDLGDLEARVETELRVDERVDDARCAATFADERITLDCIVTPAVGRTFRLVLAVSDITVEILTAGVIS